MKLNTKVAMAATIAFTFAQELGFRSGVLEGDSLSVIEALKSKERSLAPLGLLIEDAKEITERFDQLIYSHTKRDGNSVTHGLVKHALGIPDFLVWIDSHHT